MQNDLDFSNFKIRALEQEKEALQEALSKLRNDFLEYKKQMKAKMKELEGGQSKKSGEMQALLEELSNAKNELTKVKAELMLAESKHEEIVDQLKKYYDEYIDKVNGEIERKDAQIEKDAIERREEFDQLQGQKTELALSLIHI